MPKPGIFTRVIQSSETGLRRQLRAELQQGILMSADPENANLSALAIRATTIHSRWYTLTCKVCRDKFREADRVRLCPECGEPYHDDAQYDLRCWQAHFTGGKNCLGLSPSSAVGPGEPIAPCPFRGEALLRDESIALPATPVAASPPPTLSGDLVRQFVSGVETAWRPYGERQSQKIAPGSHLVGRRCPWCRFRVRAGDWVVPCPCGSHCGTYFHQDVFRHLTCWNEWYGVSEEHFCPNTGHPFEPTVRLSRQVPHE